jgi:hypothetical protein
LEHVESGVVKEVVVAHKDRLARFGVELIEGIIHRRGAHLIFLDQKVHSPQQELVEDLLAVTHVFSCRLNGKRRYASIESDGKNSEEEIIHEHESTTKTRSKKTIKRRKKRESTQKDSVQNVLVGDQLETTPPALQLVEGC